MLAPSPLPIAAMLAVAVLAGCQTVPPTSPEAVGEVRKGSGFLNGYLDRQALPDSLALLPPPPAPGSAQAAADLQTYEATRGLRGTPRWELARRDNTLDFPAAAEAFACALGVPVSQEHTPHLTMLLRRTLADAGLATYRAKDNYQRKRPFAELGTGTCVPEYEARLAADGSYPSGHSAIGWAWGLTLAEVAPERTDALVRRGYAFGQSRVVCGVHWQSDVDAGRMVGAAALARLHADEAFRSQLALAREEVQAQRARGAKPGGDCAAEAAALGR